MTTGTDWERLKNMTDAEKMANALSDPDNPPVKEDEARDFVRASDIPGETVLEKYRNLIQGRRQRLLTEKALGDAHDAFAGLAAKAGIETEDDVQALVDEVRYGK